jgi:hypothetical protein
MSAATTPISGQAHVANGERATRYASAVGERKLLMQAKRFFMLAFICANLCVAACGRGKSETGVPECDRYLLQYEKRVADHVPTDRKTDFEENLKRMRAAWSAIPLC